MSLVDAQAPVMNSSKQVPGGFFQPPTLEVDEQIIDRNLRFFDSSGSSGSLNNDPSLLPMFRQGDQKKLLPEPELPSIAVVPDPGMCIKTKNVKGEKVFINVCRVHAIPPPKPISEEALQDIITSEDYDSDYRVPMSLGAPRTEKDKSGHDCYACDVAVNTVWYEETMVDSLTFTTFLVTVAMEGHCNKYGDVCNLDRQNWSILRNKRYMGKPQRHTIQQRANATKIEELSGNTNDFIKPLASSKPLITPIREQPAFILLKNPPESDLPNEIVATIQVPKLITKSEMSLEMGEDRLVLLSDAYTLDIFLPFDLNPNTSLAEFHREKRELTVKMKVVQ